MIAKIILLIVIRLVTFIKLDNIRGAQDVADCKMGNLQSRGHSALWELLMRSGTRSVEAYHDLLHGWGAWSQYAGAGLLKECTQILAMITLHSLCLCFRITISYTLHLTAFEVIDSIYLPGAIGHLEGPMDSDKWRLKGCLRRHWSRQVPQICAAT